MSGARITCFSLVLLAGATERGAGAGELRELLRRQRALLTANLLVLLSAIWAMAFKPI